MQYKGVKGVVSGVNKALRCVFLRWVTADEVDKTEILQSSLPVSQIKEGVYYGLVPLGSIVSTVNVWC